MKMASLILVLCITFLLSIQCNGQNENATVILATTVRIDRSSTGESFVFEPQKRLDFESANKTCYNMRGYLPEFRNPGDLTYVTELVRSNTNWTGIGENKTTIWLNANLVKDLQFEWLSDKSNVTLDMRLDMTCERKDKNETENEEPIYLRSCCLMLTIPRSEHQSRAYYGVNCDVDDTVQSLCVIPNKTEPNSDLKLKDIQDSLDQEIRPLKKIEYAMFGIFMGTAFIYISLLFYKMSRTGSSSFFSS